MINFNSKTRFFLEVIFSYKKFMTLTLSFFSFPINNKCKTPYIMSNLSYMNGRINMRRNGVFLNSTIVFENFLFT